MLEHSLRICIISPELAPFRLAGGIGQHVKILAEEFHARGHEVTVAGVGIHAETELSHPWGRSVSLTPVHFRGDWRLPSDLPLGAAFAVRRYLQRSRTSFDIVEVSNWPGHAAFLRGVGLPYVVRLSSPAIECTANPAEARWAHRFESRTCRKANLILANSKASQVKLTRLYRCASVPSAIVHYGVPDVEASELPLPTEHLRLLYVGRAEHRKGTDIFIQALANVLPRCPEMRISILGADIPLYVAQTPSIRPAWKMIMSNHQHQLCLRGVVSEEAKLAAYATAHWLIFPSRFESFGLVGIEAMRAGTPVIASSGGSLPEILGKNPANRIYGDPESVDDLVRELLDIHRVGRQRAMNLRTLTRNTYLQHYTSARFADESLRHYQTVLGAAPLPQALRTPHTEPEV